MYAIDGVDHRGEISKLRMALRHPAMGDHRLNRGAFARIFGFLSFRHDPGTALGQPL
jgi:hypothetical protein